jgi:hypothetical protein
MARRFAFTAVAAAGLSALALIPGSALAFPEGGGHLQQDIQIDMQSPPACGVSASAPTQALHVGLINDDGFVNGPSVQSAIINALNNAGVVGFCTGANNTVILTRTPFTLANNGAQQNGFARAVLYDVSVSVSNDSSTFSDSTADGPSAGSHAGPFGPTGAGAPFTFSAASGGGALTQPAAVVVSNPADDGPTASFTNRPNARLVAGPYESILTLSLTPGL